MSTLASQQGELKVQLARARNVAEFYAGKRVPNVVAIGVLLYQLDRLEKQLARARRVIFTNGRAA
jgi:hypothetical protein